MSDLELYNAICFASDGVTDATALVQEWFDRYRDEPPPGMYRLSRPVRV